MDLLRRALRPLAAVPLIVMTVAVARAPAAGADIQTLRARAQRIADRVTASERRLETLRAESERLEIDALRATQRIQSLEIKLNDTRAAFDRARDHYVARAVEFYKEGPVADLALVLSADDLAGAMDAAEAAARAAESDRRSLDHLTVAATAQQRAQRAIDERKQYLLRAQARNSAVMAEIESVLASRRGALVDLRAEIAKLQERARLAALRGASGDAAFARALGVTGPSPEIPDGYVGTGITFEGIASWYGPGFAGQSTASGVTFDPRLYTAASRDLPFGTILHVEYEGAGVVVVINDRGPFIEDRILDLSKAAARAIGLGLGWVRAEILVPEP